MAGSTMIRCCLLKCLLFVVLVECDATTMPTAEPNEKLNEGLVPYILGLPETIARALDRIHRSTRNYRLMDDIWFEVKPKNAGADKNKSASKSPPKNLVEQADAVFDTHRLSWHNAIVQGLDLNIYKDKMQKYTFDIIKRTQNPYDLHTQGTRTFGMHRRRMQLVMLPVMYKLGVITTLLIGLTVLSVKGVTIGVLLLVLAVAGVVAKVSKYQHHHHHDPYGPYAAYAHDPYDRAASQPAQLHQASGSRDKDIHVHVHTAPGAVSSYGHHATLKGSSLAYDGQAPTADDNANGPYYWSRHGEDYYYDASASAAAATNNNNNNYHLNNRRIGNGDADSTTTNSVYPWLG